MITQYISYQTALEQAGDILKMEAWKTELLISMARVILRNNYVQTSSGIYLLQSCLAMGNSSSGACLTLVGLTSEYHRLTPPHNPKNNNLLCPSAYFRYLDDTKAIIESNNKVSMAATIINIGTMFPSTIPINVDLFHICSSFLDIITIRKLSSGTFSTLLKKNLSSPPAYIPFMSAIPSHYKLSALKTEMIRIRRTCSKPIFVWHMDNLLIRELNTLGHKNASIELNKFKTYIATNYDHNMSKITKDDEDNEQKKVYGATSKMEQIGGTHHKVTNIIKNALGDQETNLPMLVPSFKLKEILHTRRKYLAKLQ